MNYRKNKKVQFNTIGLEGNDINFFPGRGWLYFKIYTNQNCIDRLIVDSINFLNHTIGDTQFFFTRYYDEYNLDHLRFRIKLTNAIDIGSLIEAFNRHFQNCIYVRNVMIDTYHREIIRYGWPSILKVEELFCIDSFIVYSFLLQNLILNDIDKMKFCLYGIYHYLVCFDFSKSEMIQFIVNTKNNFFREFNVDKKAKKSFNNVYLKYFRDKVDFENYNNFESFTCRENICKTFEDYEIGKKDEDFVWSIIHMFINKIFSKQYRLYEMVAYDYIGKILMSEIKRNKL